MSNQDRYIDDLGDTIEVINGVEYVVATKEDLKALNMPKEKHSFISLDNLKKILNANRTN
jgi:hypothetical protein